MRTRGSFQGDGTKHSMVELAPDGKAPRMAHGVTSRRLVIAGGIVLALVAGGGIVWSLSTGSGDTVAKPAATPSATASPAANCLATAAETSSAFDYWSGPSWVEGTAASESVRFTSSAESYSADNSMKIVSSVTQGAEVERLRQSVGVTSGETLRISFWAKATNAGDGAVTVQLSPDGVTNSMAVPGGTFDWTEVSLEYVIPDGQTALDLRIAVEGPTEGTWIDALAVTGEDGQQRLVNADFESNSGNLAIKNSSLMLPSGQAAIELESGQSRTGTLTWTVRSADDESVLAGDGIFTDCKSTVDLAALDNGFYSLDIVATLDEKTIERTTTFGIVESVPDGASDESPFGIFLHYDGGETRRTNLIKTLADSGVRHARVEIPWDLVETTPGTYNYPASVDATIAAFKKDGIEPLLVPAYYNPLYDDTKTPSSPEGLAAYAAFSADVIRHYGYAGVDLEVYNEFDHTFNNGLCGRTPECYMEMLEPTVQAVKSANPDSVIAAPGNAGMGMKLDSLQAFFDVGGLKYADIVSAHPYTQPDAPEKIVSDLDDLHGMILEATGGTAKPVWLTEMGWSSVDGWVTREAQSDYLVRTMALSLGHGVSRVYWFEGASLSLNAQSIEENFGLFEAPQSLIPNASAPKPAAVAQAVLAREISGKQFSAVELEGTNVFSYVFGDKTDDVRLMWTADSSADVSINATGSVVVKDTLGQVRRIKPEDGVVQLELTGSPVYVSGEISAVTKD